MRGKIKYTLLLATFLTCSNLVFSQSCDGSQIFKDVRINADHFVTWTVINDCKDAVYQIKEFRWNKWISLGKVNGKGKGSNSYSFGLKGACDLYEIRIEIKGNRRSRSQSIENPIKPSATAYTVGETNIIFTNSTRYEIYSTEGIRILTGCAEKVRVAELKKGAYYLNYGKQMVKFERK